MLQSDTFEASVLFAQTEGIVPAPESSHVIPVGINESMDTKEKGEEQVILFTYQGMACLTSRHMIPITEIT